MNLPLVPLQMPRLAVVTLLTALAAWGCAARKADVTGTVRYRNEPVVTGSVSFYTENGEIRSSLLSPDGSYHLTQLPPGSVRVAVVSHPPVPPALHVDRAPAALAPNSRKTTVPQRPISIIPERYSRPDSSGLHFIVNPGEQVLDIDLAP
jgi:hypothetical protein